MEGVVGRPGSDDLLECLTRLAKIGGDEFFGHCRRGRRAGPLQRRQRALEKSDVPEVGDGRRIRSGAGGTQGVDDSTSKIVQPSSCGRRYPHA